jgi:hypothetical protein
MNQQASIAIALAAGIVGGMIAIAGLQPTAFSLPLLVLAPAPVYFAALGWGTRAGVIAAVTATVLGLVWQAPIALAFGGALLFAPAAYAGHLANLAQPNPAGPGMIWYPLSGILLRLMLMLMAGFIVTGLAVGYDQAKISEAFAIMFRDLMADGGATAPSDEVLRSYAETYTSMLPAIFAGMWLLGHVLVLHLSAIATARMGRLARPPEDIAANITLPREALAMPLFGVIGMFFLGSPGIEIAALAAGLGIAGFAMVGLGELHTMTRGRPGRGAILMLSYLLLLVFGFPVFVLAVMGALRALRSNPNNPSIPGPPRGGSSNNQTS